MVELDYLNKTLIDNLIDKCHVLIQKHLVTREKNLTNLLQLAICCQKIEYMLKKIDHN